MGKYLIHTCKDRYWYVRYYLVPSLKRQGIAKDDIVIYNDTQHDGQLKSLIKSYDAIGEEDAWHLQDDIIISSKFKEKTEKYDDGIVCGFCNKFSIGRPGRVNIFDMWYSMSCIRIPGTIFKEFVTWLNEPSTRNTFRCYFEENKHDDVLFEAFLKNNYPRLLPYNLAPNLVNHIDHLLGGSIINKTRDKPLEFIMSTYWDEPKLLIDIEKKLKKGGRIA